MKPNTVDLNGHVTLNIAALKLFGLWFFTPYSKKSYKFWLHVIMRIFIGLFVFVVPNLGQMTYLIKSINAGEASVKEAAGILNLILIELLATVKFIDMQLRRHSLIALIKELNSKEFQTADPDHVKILAEGIALSRKMFLIFLSSASSDVFVHMIIVPALHKFSTTPVKMDLLFFDINDERFFPYVCAYQILYKPLMVTCFTALQSLTWSCMKCATCQLEVLIKKIENIDVLIKNTMVSRGCDENEAFEVIFHDCFSHYHAIVRYTKAMQAAFSGQLSSTLFLSAGIIGSTAVQILSIQSPTKQISEVVWTISFLAIMILNLFVDCYFGNDVTYKSAAISTIVFGCPWISLTKELKRNVVIFIAVTQQPIKLTAAKLFPVSIATFTTVMNWTYKGFAVMNQMK